MYYRKLFLLILIAAQEANAQPKQEFAQPKQTRQSTQELKQQREDSDVGYPLNLKSVGLTLPSTNDPELMRVLSDANTIFYKLSPVWQHYVPPSIVEERNLTLEITSRKTRKMIWGIYHAKYRPDTHSNFDFPWETTAGLNAVKKENNKNFDAVNFINLPKADNGSVLPVWVLNEYPVKWIFPEGTTVGEVIYVVFDGVKYIQEIRTRTKEKNSDFWEPNVYRPIKSREEYIELTNSVDYIPAKRYMFFRNQEETEVQKMEGLVERLPPLAPDKVKKLLSRKFQNINEENWSPCSDQEFHILPKLYSFSLIGGGDGINKFTCAECHRQTQISVRELVPLAPSVIEDPEGTGNIRGCDSVFTWHPFSYDCVRSSNEEQQTQPLFRRIDADNGFIHLSKTPPNKGNYKLTLFVQKALKEYALPRNKSATH
jgi:hypothetical protein